MNNIIIILFDLALDNKRIVFMELNYNKLHPSTALKENQ